MKIKELIKSYGFWTALAGALVVFINAIGKIFGFYVEESLISDIIMAIAGILVVFGIVTMPKNFSSVTSTQDQNMLEEDQTQKENDDQEQGELKQW